MSMCCTCVIAVIVVLVFVGSYHIASYRHPCWRLQRCSPGLAGPESNGESHVLNRMPGLTVQRNANMWVEEQIELHMFFAFV